MKTLLISLLIASGVFSGGCSSKADTTIKVDNVSDVLAEDLIDYVDNDYLKTNFVMINDKYTYKETNGDVLDYAVLYENAKTPKSENNIDGLLMHYEVNFKENTIKFEKMAIADAENGFEGDIDGIQYFKTEAEVASVLPQINKDYKIPSGGDASGLQDIIH